MKRYIGMDVHSKETTYVTEDDDGTVVAEGSIPTSREGIKAMICHCMIPAGSIVGLETGTQATLVNNILVELGMNPVVINATEVRRKARRVGQKTDRRDAFEICEGVRKDTWDSIVYMPGEQIIRLRRILSRRRHFVRMSTAQINAAMYLLRTEGMLQNQQLSLTSKSGWDDLVKREEIDSIRDHILLHAKTWKIAGEHVNWTEKELKEAIEPVREIVELLMSIPGVGLITSVSYVATLGNVERFADSNHVISYLGLAPSMNDSGSKKIHGPITKAGSSQMRSVLCEAAQHASRITHPLNPYYRRIASRKGHKKAVVAIAQRLARIMYQMWKKKEVFDTTKLNVERDGKERKKVYQWRIKPEAVARSV